ncbi:MAG: ISAs1 family transposase [Phycisphaeraceae bacterium]|nr:ISAs1 family transposase [Phycisphaeraceae bacterium]MBX3391888.1 ISAs1 family transposase [Phycisphaeraceae bacterium]MBX3392019.1 ISAs1 family transposase [Phycisphaeraceae bacterium]
MTTTSVTRHFGDLPDPRSDHGKRYPLVSVITIAICGVICGSEDWVGVAAFGRAKRDWFATFLDLPGDTPTHDTFARIFARLDPDAFEACFRAWTNTLVGELSGTIALDGKTLRRSFDAASGKAAIHMVSAWAGEHGLVFGQLAVGDKSNEITAIPRLLELLDLKAMTVTIDAIGCQKAIAEKIVKGGGEYVLAVKDNQPTLHADVARVFDRAAGKGWRDAAHDTHVEVDKGHGRIETRTTTITWSPRDLVEASGWPGVACLVRVQRERTIGDATTKTTHHFIASVETRKAERIAAAVRSHWGVENQLHWRLDVCFNEDNSRLRAGHGAQNMSRLRRIALNALRHDTSEKMGIRNKRLMAGWDHRYLLRLLASPSG